MSREKLFIFDTTKRDGDQTALARDMNAKDKLRLGRQLERLGVDIIEAGFPANGRDELEAVAQVARQVRNPIICGLARAVEGDIDAAWAALQYARRPRIHVFLSTSDIHLKYQMNKTRDEVMEAAVYHVRYARSLCEDVQFSPMDATRTEPKYLYQVLEAVIQAGATTVNIPDTVGTARPSTFGRLIRDIFQNVPSIGRARVSVHCHDDHGFASANSITAVEEGARQIEGCINGIGERAGNAATEEIIMYVYRYGEDLGVYTEVNTREIWRTSALVRRITRIPVSPLKSIVGANVFAHKSGIHQAALLNNRGTFEIMSPADIGRETKLELVLGATSGKAAVQHEALIRFGIELTGSNLVAVRNMIVSARREGIKITDATFLEMMQKAEGIQDQ